MRLDSFLLSWVLHLPRSTFSGGVRGYQSLAPSVLSLLLKWLPMRLTATEPDLPPLVKQVAMQNQSSRRCRLMSREGRIACSQNRVREEVPVHYCLVPLGQDLGSRAAVVEAVL